MDMAETVEKNKIFSSVRRLSDPGCSYVYSAGSGDADGAEQKFDVIDRLNLAAGPADASLKPWTSAETIKLQRSGAADSALATHDRKRMCSLIRMFKTVFSIMMLWRQKHDRNGHLIQPLMDLDFDMEVERKDGIEGQLEKSVQGKSAYRRFSHPLERQYAFNLRRMLVHSGSKVVNEKVIGKQLQRWREMYDTD